MTVYHLNVGSNLGDRRDNVSRAVALLCERAAARDVAVSEPVESAPWGYDSPNSFINVGVTLNSALTPLQLLDLCQAIEREIGSGAHRSKQGQYLDRIVDIDIIAAGDTILHSPRLTLPHPRMHLRRFVLEPMAAVSPDWRHPVTRLTAAQMLKTIG